MRKIHEITAENDIKYRGPLSYRHIRILGWLFLVIAQIGVLLDLYSKLDPEAGISSGKTVFFGVFSDLAMPCFLLANFAIILNGKSTYRTLLLRFGAISASFVAAFFLIFEHYGMGISSRLLGSHAEALGVVAELLNESGGYLAFNLFIDLLLCTLFMFFLNYEPKRVFVGKKLLIFRLFAILPVVYEAISVIIKVLASMGKLRLSIYICPFLTTKPPVMFVVFIALALFLKLRERRFEKQGKTKEEYAGFIDTNANSLRVSIFTAVLFAAAAALDLLLVLIISALVVSGMPETEDAYMKAALMVSNWGFGQSSVIIFLSPVVMLFSYTRLPKEPKYDIIVSVGGVGAIVYVYVEGIYQIVCALIGKGG